MSELFNHLYHEQHEAPESVPERDILNSISKEDIEDFIFHCAEKKAEINRLGLMAIEVHNERFGEDI